MLFWQVFAFIGQFDDGQINFTQWGEKKPWSEDRVNNLAHTSGFSLSIYISDHGVGTLTNMQSCNLQGGGCSRQPGSASWSHWPHWWDFSPMSLFNCVLKLPFQEDAKSHWLQGGNCSRESARKIFNPLVQPAGVDCQQWLVGSNCSLRAPFTDPQSRGSYMCSNLFSTLSTFVFLQWEWYI